MTASWRVGGGGPGSSRFKRWSGTHCPRPTDLLLRVRSVDLMKSSQGANRTQHHTHLYQTEAFVIRRGQRFQMWIGLSRPFHPSGDKLHLLLKTGWYQTDARVLACEERRKHPPPTPTIHNQIKPFNKKCISCRFGKLLALNLICEVPVAPNPVNSLD